MDRHRIGGTPVQPPDPRCHTTWQAKWLRDPLFEGVPYRELISPGREPKLNGEIQNIHTLFRKELQLGDGTVRKATLHITADDCYKLYLNGTFVGLGPASSYPFNYHYNTWDVTALLKPGVTNCVGVHVFYQGMHSLTFASGDNLQGLLLQLEIEFAHGSTTTLVSDEHWRYRQTDAYEARQVYGYQTAFSEHIDLRKLIVGWALPGYDDREWQTPLAGTVPEQYTLAPQPTPPVHVFKRRPMRVVRKGDGHYFIDFGTELSGETVFRVTGGAGHVVEIRHGEELIEPDTVRYEMRCNCKYQEFCTLSGRADEVLEFFDYKGFRYVEVLNWPDELTIDRVWAHERHYPFDETASDFSSADPLLNDIWSLCRSGVRVGTIDNYLDCPTREKGGFLGDGYVTGISHLILTGDARILRKFLKDVANTGRYCDGLHSTAPNYVNGELAEYSLLWPVLLEYYYQWTGDLDFLREMMPVLLRLLRYYAVYENDSGLLQDLVSRATGRYSILVDWPMNLRDGYDDPYLMGARTADDEPLGIVNTMVQGFYRMSLQAGERLAGITGDDEIRRLVGGRADRVRDAALTQLRSATSGLFVDRNGVEHASLHASVTPLMSGMLSPDQRGPVIDLIRQKRLSCGVYFSFFVLKALYDAGESELAHDLITSRDLHSWHSMLQAGATTCMEAWAPDLKWNTSWCHPWSSAPIHMLAHEMLGLRPGLPGWASVRFAPRPPATLPSASVRIRTPRGEVSARFERAENQITYRLSVPRGCQIECEFDDSVRRVVVDENEAPLRPEQTGFGVPCVALSPLQGGEHTIVTSPA